jgi:hypothetical protein
LIKESAALGRFGALRIHRTGSKSRTSLTTLRETLLHYFSRPFFASQRY